MINIEFEDTNEEQIKQTKQVCKKCLMLWAEQEQTYSDLNDNYVCAEERMLEYGDLFCKYGHSLVKHGQLDGLIPETCHFRLEHMINENIKQELYDLWDNWEASDCDHI